MIRWLMTGILRDKTRSLFPFLTVGAGVALMIALLGFMDGVFMGMVDITANLDTGHLRFLNKSFYEEEHLAPMDWALGGQKETREWLEKNGPAEVQWAPRIRWTAIMDVPDAKGETRNQTPVVGMGIDIASPGSPELQRLKLKESLVRGRLPGAKNEMLAGYLLAETLKLNLGDSVTLIGQSFDGGMAADNYAVVGLVRFGVFAMDKKMAVVNLADAQRAFYMENMVTEWAGYFPSRVSFAEYEKARELVQSRLPSLLRNPPSGWAKDDNPVILSILDQRNIREIAKTFDRIRKIIVWIFLILMVLVLWNAGLLNGIHRYGEMGLRLALGETHALLMFSLAVEAFMIGVLGSAAGSLLGGAAVYYLQEVGVNMGDAFAQTGVIINDVVRGRLSLAGFLYGIVPGMTASVVGSLVAATSIFNRSEANLFRELET